jgi:hypothetical protein
MILPNDLNSKESGKFKSFKFEFFIINRVEEDPDNLPSILLDLFKESRMKQKNKETKILGQKVLCSTIVEVLESTWGRPSGNYESKQNFVCQMCGQDFRNCSLHIHF